MLCLPTVAGNFVTAIEIAAFGLSDPAAMFSGAGLLAWLALESILMHRLYIHAPLSPPMRPTLGIQLAPAVVCCSGYLSLTYRSDRGSSAVLVCKGRQRRYAVSMVAGCARARSTRVARLQCHPVSLASRNRQFRCG